MLVLTRRRNDKIVFPQVGITIHFVRIQSGNVKVGIEAPREIRILRNEQEGDSAITNENEPNADQIPSRLRHDLRNELHQIGIGLHLYKELLGASLEDEAAETFADVTAALRRLDQHEALNPPPVASDEDTSLRVSDPESRSGSSTVVLVEDQANEREMLASILRLKNVSVVALEDGDQAIEYFKHNPAPGYLLIDMNMPHCDGATAISQLRSEGKLDETTVYAVSGSSPEVHGVPVGNEGVDRWFQKPVNPSSLFDALKIAAE